MPGQPTGGVRCITCKVAALATNEHGLSDTVRNFFVDVHGTHETAEMASTKPDAEEGS